MEACDALIIGGGPAGSSCAWHLKRHGLDVIVIDKAEFPRNKVCAGWITPAVLQTLEIDPGAYAQGRILQPISAFRTGLINGHQLATDYSATVSYGIRRCEFDDYLLQRTGARLHLRQALKSLQRDGSHFCPVARYLGAELGAGEAAVAAKEVEFEMTTDQIAACRIRPEMPELYFCPDLKGYGWCFRKGRYLNIGLGMEQTHRLSSALESFCGVLRQRGRIPQDIPEKFHGHAYLLRGRSKRTLLDDGVLLVGDAAGLAYPQSGEGIRPAVESGLMAATTVLQAGADYRRQRLTGYRDRLQARYGSATAEMGGAGSEMLRSLAARMLLRSRWFTRHVLLDRWFLQKHQAEFQVN